MREIKFRAWDPRSIEGRMVNVSSLQFNDWVNVNGDVPLALMQYTGLKDKNGVEIYEGDIVSCDQGQDLGFKVVGVVHYGIDTRSDWPDPRIYLDTRPFEEFGSQFCIFHKNPEVIGNIYENPELVK